MENSGTFTAFDGHSRIAHGDVKSVVLKMKARLTEQPNCSMLVFDDSSGQQVDFDLSGSSDDVLGRLATHPALAVSQQSAGRTGPGRPKLGVVSREISLLPRHWEWLEQQPQGASAAIRRLIDDTRKREPDAERLRLARDAASKFMWSMAGNFEGFEEASRALFSGDRNALQRNIESWPKDVREHLLHMLEPRC